MPLPREVFEKIVYYRREVERIWQDYLGPARPPGPEVVPAPVDVYETDAAIVIDVELPGVPASAIEVSVSTDVLVVEGERQDALLSRGPGARYHHAERAHGRFQRILEIPRAGDMRRLEAQLQGGILKITIPKVDDRRGRWRRVEVADLDAADRRGSERAR